LFFSEWTKEVDDDIRDTLMQAKKEIEESKEFLPQKIMNEELKKKLNNALHKINESH
jgi:hypothetical protein